MGKVKRAKGDLGLFVFRNHLVTYFFIFHPLLRALLCL